MPDSKAADKREAPALPPERQEALDALAAKLQHAHFPPSHALWLELCALAKRAHGR